MRKTLTIRTDEALRGALARRAQESGVSMSELARSILWDALGERPLGERVGHLRGSISLDTSATAWYADLRDRNWRE